MAKQISITYNDKKYTLGYDRSIVSRLEKAGVDIQNPGARPATDIPLMFEAAFALNKYRITSEMAMDILASMKDKVGLIRTLYEMANETLEVLMVDSEGDEGNATWGVVE